MKTISLYDALAGLLIYPGGDYHARVARAVDTVNLVILSAAKNLSSGGVIPSEAKNLSSGAVIPSEARNLSSCAESLDRFAEHIRDFSIEALQELFIQTFDMNPERSLEAGWHLFGENYDRGTFLVKMRRQLRRFGIGESTELPDHITHVLAVLGRMPEGEAEEFAVACVAPALAKIQAGFGEKSAGNPFRNVLDALAGVLRAQYGDALLESTKAAPSLRVLESAPDCAACVPAFSEEKLP